MQAHSSITSVNQSKTFDSSNKHSNLSDCEIVNPDSCTTSINFFKTFSSLNNHFNLLDCGVIKPHDALIYLIGHSTRFGFDGVKFVVTRKPRYRKKARLFELSLGRNELNFPDMLSGFRIPGIDHSQIGHVHLIGRKDGNSNPFIIAKYRFDDAAAFKTGMWTPFLRNTLYYNMCYNYLDHYSLEFSIKNNFITESMIKVDLECVILDQEKRILFNNTASPNLVPMINDKLELVLHNKLASPAPNRKIYSNQLVMNTSCQIPEEINLSGFEQLDFAELYVCGILISRVSAKYIDCENRRIQFFKWVSNSIHWKDAVCSNPTVKISIGAVVWTFSILMPIESASGLNHDVIVESHQGLFNVIRFVDGVCVPVYSEQNGNPIPKTRRSLENKWGFKINN